MDQNDTTLRREIGGSDLLSQSTVPSSSLDKLSPLTHYALNGLRQCWDDRYSRWSFKYHLDARSAPNEFRPEKDLYYSLNVLLGLAKVQAEPNIHGYPAAHILESICRALSWYPVRNGTWGMALWAATELGLSVPGVAADRLRPIAGDPASIATWTAQDVGLSLSGVAAQLEHDRSWLPVAQGLRDLLIGRFRGPGALFRDSGVGFRRHIATFATQVYASLALYQFGAIAGDHEALAIANRCVEKLIDLQGPQGEWSWFFSPRTDTVLDPYEVYSVHQHGMAPALLHHAAQHGVLRARSAIEHGFKWIFGENALGVSMLVPAQHLIYRSQARRGLQGLRATRLVRSGQAAITKPGWPDASLPLRITREMRSYEYGWLLWSFAAEAGYPDITHHRLFKEAI